MRKGIRITVYVVFALTLLYFVAEWFLEAKIRYFVEKKVEEVSRGGCPCGNRFCIVAADWQVVVAGGGENQFGHGGFASLRVAS